MKDFFSAKLECIEKVIPNLNRGPYKVQEWQEVVPAQIPEQFRGKINYVKLDQQMRLHW